MIDATDAGFKEDEAAATSGFEGKNLEAKPTWDLSDKHFNPHIQTLHSKATQSKQIRKASDFLLVVQFESETSISVFSPDFEIEVSLQPKKEGTFKWTSFAILEIQAEIERRLTRLNPPHPKPKKLSSIFLSQSGSKSPTRTEMAKALGVSLRTLELHRKKGASHLSKKSFTSIRTAHSPFDYPLIIGIQDGSKRVFSPDLNVGRSIDPTLDPIVALEHALRTVFILGENAYASLTPKPLPSRLAPKFKTQIQAKGYPKLLPTSEASQILGISQKTLLRKHRGLAKLTPGGHLRWDEKVILDLKSGLYSP